jgi:hypothetical protein
MRSATDVSYVQHPLSQRTQPQTAAVAARESSQDSFNASTSTGLTTPKLSIPAMLVVELTEKKQDAIRTLSPEVLKWKTARDTYAAETSFFERIKKRSLRNDFNPQTGLNALGLTKAEVDAWDTWVENNKAHHANYLERRFIKAYEKHIEDVENRFHELQIAQKLLRTDCVIKSCQLEGELKPLVSDNPRAEIEYRKSNLLDKQQQLLAISCEKTEAKDERLHIAQATLKYAAQEAQKTLESALEHIEAAFKLLNLKERIMATDHWNPVFEEELKYYELYGTANSLVQQSLHHSLRMLMSEKKEQQRIFEQNLYEAQTYAQEKLVGFWQLAGTWRVAADPQICRMIEEYRIQLNQCTHKSQIDPVVQQQRKELNKEIPAARLKLLVADESSARQDLMQSIDAYFESLKQKQLIEAEWAQIAMKRRALLMADLILEGELSIDRLQKENDLFFNLIGEFIANSKLQDINFRTQDFLRLIGAYPAEKNINFKACDLADYGYKRYQNHSADQEILEFSAPSINFSLHPVQLKLLRAFLKERSAQLSKIPKSPEMLVNNMIQRLRMEAQKDLEVAIC